MILFLIGLYIWIFIGVIISAIFARLEGYPVYDGLEIFSFSLLWPIILLRVLFVLVSGKKL